MRGSVCGKSLDGLLDRRDCGGENKNAMRRFGFIAMILLFGGISAVLAQEADAPAPAPVRSLEQTRDRLENAQDRQELRQERRDEARERLSERRKENIRRYVRSMLRKLEAAIERLGRIADRIESRLERFEERGADVASSRAKLAEAREELSDAQNALAGIEEAVTDALASENPHDAFASVRGILKGAAEDIRAAHAALVDAVTALRGVSTAVRQDAPRDASENGE